MRRMPAVIRSPPCCTMVDRVCGLSTREGNEDKELQELEEKEGGRQRNCDQCWMINENPSTHDAQEPAIPAIL